MLSIVVRERFAEPFEFLGKVAVLEGLATTPSTETPWYAVYMKIVLLETPFHVRNLLCV